MSAHTLRLARTVDAVHQMTAAELERLMAAMMARVADLREAAAVETPPDDDGSED